jgi:sterol regulatory element-binding transcription factor 1
MLEECYKLSDKSGLHLRESISLSSYQSASKPRQLAQLLCCDWLLATRTDIWERSCVPEESPSPVDPDLLFSFQYDLESLQKLTHDVPPALPRVRQTAIIIKTKPYGKTREVLPLPGKNKT